ncbi:MAG: branched-chain amino acid ABC transporter permease [Porticoccaceae bacterium]
MIYRNSGDMKTSYAQELALFPVSQERWALILLLTVGGVVLPLTANNYWLGSILLPFLVLSLAAIGANILIGYAGQISLGSGGFMAVGAYAAVNAAIRLPSLPFPITLLIAGVAAAAVCALFGLLSLRIKGLYVVVATLAAQFMIEWVCTHWPWLYLNNASGIVGTPPVEIFGIPLTSIAARYEVAFITVVLLALLARNLVRSPEGRGWLAVRDKEVAAVLTGVATRRAKITAFAVCGFFCGIAGALWSFLYLGNVDVEGFTMHRSFQILFMVIIGGLGSIAGSFLGAAFIVLLPVAITNLAAVVGGSIRPDTVAHLELMIFGAMIIGFLILEPRGLARLAGRAREHLRNWPLKY